jgi:hypothetical protein
MTNTRYLLISPRSRASGDRLEVAGFNQVYQWQGLQVFENRMANERAYIVHDWIVEPDEVKLQEAVLETLFDVKKRVALPEDPGIERVTDSAMTAKDLVMVETYKNDFISLKTVSQADGILVLADNWYPAWKAFIDGIETDVSMVNGAFRGIVLPAGEHTVEYRYISETHKTGRFLTMAGLLIVAMVVGGHGIRSRKKGKSETV